MRRSLWVMLFMGMAGVLVLGWASQSMMRTTSGVEESLLLQDTLRSSWPGVFAREPALRVMRIPASGEWSGWRWRVEATLVPGGGRGGVLERTLDRLVRRTLAVQVMGRDPAGVMVVLHVPGGADRILHHDARGRAVDERGRPFPPPSPAALPAAPAPPPPAPPGENPK